MKPISEIALALMDAEEAEQVRKHLEKRCQCRVSRVSKGHYLLRLPAGSTEEACPSPDSRHREETVITLPNGEKLKKAVKWPCIRPGCTHTYVFVLDEPEEEPEKKERRRRYNVNQPLSTIEPDRDRSKARRGLESQSGATRARHEVSPVRVGPGSPA